VTRPDAGPARRPHVVMLVENDVVVDTRVQKEAFALARAGLRVTLLGVAAGEERVEQPLGPCHLVRVPVGTDAVRAHAARTGRPVAVPPAGTGTDQVADLRERMAARRRAIAVASRQAAARRAGASGPVAAAGYTAGVAVRRAQQEALRLGGRLLSGRVRIQALSARAQRVTRRAVEARRTQAVDGVRWQDDLPEVHDFDRAFGPVVDELAPDVIHAHDVRTTIVAVRACERARAAGRLLPWVYDAHEYVAGLSLYGRRTPRVVAAWTDLERETVRSADRVITVSPQIASELRTCYGLSRLPSVVLNIPSEPVAALPAGTAGTADPADDLADESDGDLRGRLGLATDVPLLVYSGKVTAARGVQTAVEALPSMPGTHLAVVSVPHTRTHAVRILAELARELGVEDRVHLLEPVAPSQVVAFLRSADVGLIPLLHFGSHEMALTNKLFEYLHAGVPVVVSDCRAQEAFVREHRVGESFPAEDAAALAKAVGQVLADPLRYVEAITPDLLEQYSWGRQEQHLRDLYRDLLGADALAAEDALDDHVPTDAVVVAAEAS